MPLFELEGHDAKAIANFYLNLAAQEARPINSMHLQKILYNAHGYHLAMFDKPLFWQPVQAWKYGPVIADVYRQFREYGAGPIEGLAVHYDRKLREEIPYQTKLSLETADFLKRIWNGHKDVDPIVLSRIAHRKGSPWDIVTRGKELDIHSGVPIPNSILKEFFARFIEPEPSVDESEQYTTAQ